VASNLIGKTLGHFTVEDEIGSGGMGTVLLARQESLQRPAVLKRIRRDLAEFPELARRFEREARSAAQIHHQNVVAVYDHFRWRSDQYIAQEFVDGIDLKQAMERMGPLPWRIAVMIALEVSRGLEEVHSRGTVHRDLKPANIMLGRRGEVKIADFGLALDATGSQLTEPGVMIGSPAYMPPEQMLGERVDTRCDVFSLGVILYEMLSGRLPYPMREAPDSGVQQGEEEPNTASLLNRMQNEQCPRLRRLAPGTPRRVARLVKRCLRARPGQRIESATTLRRRLELWIEPTSPADLRMELASWLWARSLFEQRDNETVVRLSEAPSEEATTLSSPRWLTAAVVTTLAALVAASVLFIDARPRALLGAGSASAEVAESQR
jgi:serine/threonine protein kinase